MRSAVALLVLSGCLARHEPLRVAAKAERQGAEDAEERWERVIAGPLADTEYTQAHRHLCGLRVPRIRAELADAQPGDLTIDQLRTLQGQLADCNRGQSERLKLAAFQDVYAMERVNALPDATPFESLFAAAPDMALVSRRSPVWARYDGWRAAYLDHLQTLQVGPVTREHLTTLAEEAGGSPGRPADPAAPALLDTHVASFAATTDASCGGLAQTGTLDGTGAPITATWTLTDCTSSETHGMQQVPYTVERFRTEQRTRTVTTSTWTTVNVQVPAGQNCYAIGNGYQSCHTQYRTVAQRKQVPSSYEVTEAVQVPYHETEYRSELRYARETTGTVTGTLTSDHTSAGFTLRVSTHQLSASPTRPSYRDLLRDNLQRVHEHVLERARTAHLDALQRADTSTLDGVERRLLARAGGRELTPDESDAIAATLGLPTVALLADRPRLHPIQRLAPPRDPSSVHNSGMDGGVLRHGVPLRFGTLGVGRSYHTDAFRIHPAARSYELTARVDFQIPLVRRTVLGRFGFHVLGHYAGRLGWRSQRRHILRLPATDPAFPNRRESFLSHGGDAGVGLLAGTRNAVFGLFGGVMARTFYARSGYTASGAGSTPLAVRLELRPRARMPIFVNAWGYALNRRTPEDVYGAMAMFPVSPQVWLIGEFAREEARVQTLGLHRQDPVELRDQPFARAWGGLGGSF